jgi:hypothetical protein
MASAEQRRADFRRLATRRTNRILERIRILSNCANKYAYEWTQDEIDRIFEAIDRELSETRGKFASVRKNGRSEFRLR